MVAQKIIPEWARTVVGTALIVVPVILWLAAAYSMASSADARSLAHEPRIDILEQNDARADERFRSIMEILKRIDAKVDRAK